MDPELEPGESAAFELPVPVDQINFSSPGVYVIGVDIRADPADGDRLTLDTSRITVPWLPADEPLPVVPVALLWPVATAPTMLADGNLIDDSLSERLSADGPLTTLVEAPGSAPVTWIVDPDLVATVEAMADGYPVTGPNGTIPKASDPPTLLPGKRRWPPRRRASSSSCSRMPIPIFRPSPGSTTPWPVDTARAAVAATRAAGETTWPRPRRSPGQAAVSPTTSHWPRLPRPVCGLSCCPVTLSRRPRGVPSPGPGRRDRTRGRRHRRRTGCRGDGLAAF